MKSLSSAMKPMSVIKRIIAMKMLFVITQLEAMNASAIKDYGGMEKPVMKDTFWFSMHLGRHLGGCRSSPKSLNVGFMYRSTSKEL